eukprot:1011210-Rhodomonas_salina.2
MPLRSIRYVSTGIAHGVRTQRNQSQATAALGQSVLEKRVGLPHRCQLHPALLRPPMSHCIRYFSSAHRVEQAQQMRAKPALPRIRSKQRRKFSGVYLPSDVSWMMAKPVDWSQHSLCQRRTSHSRRFGLQGRCDLARAQIRQRVLEWRDELVVHRLADQEPRDCGNARGSRRCQGALVRE